MKDVTNVGAKRDGQPHFRILIQGETFSWNECICTNDRSLK